MGSSRSYLTKRREIEACRAKTKYADKTAAWAAAKALGKTARVYRCPGVKNEPRHFHVTGGLKGPGMKVRRILEWTP